MRRIMSVSFIGLVVAGCPDRESRPGEPATEAVSMDTLRWAVEGRAVEHGGARYAPVGPPVYEPLALARIGDFEGTPLYAERGVASPVRRLYIPIGGGYWQMLERADGLGPAEPDREGDAQVQPGTEGIAP
jgi:hypothetical protein